MARPAVVSASPRNLLLAFTLLFVLVLPSASAQEIFAVQITADSTEGTSTGDCVTFQPTVRNTGSSPIPPEHTIALSFTEPGDGWRLQPPQSPTLNLAPGAESRVSFTVCPTETAEPETTASVRMTAQVQDDPRTPKASAQRDFQVELQGDGLLGFDLPDAALYVAVLAVLGLIGVVLLTRRRPSAGIAVSCPEPAKEVLPDRGTSFPVRIRNEGRQRDVVTLTTSPVPRGWDTFLPLVDIPLESREEQTVWLSVKSPANARPGDQVVVKIIARSASGGAEHAEIDTLTTVRAPDAPPGGGIPWGGEPSPATGGAAPAEPAAEDRSVYGPEDEAEDERPVAVKRRKQ